MRISRDQRSRLQPFIVGRALTEKFGDVEIHEYQRDER
jgi:hypothetical protein